MEKIYKTFIFLMLFSCFSTMSMVYGQNLLQNAGFESGELDPWFGDNGSVVTIETDAHTGTYSASGNAAQNVDLKAGTEYELRCNAKVISFSGDEKVWVGVRSPEALVQNSRIFESNWEDMSIDFTAPLDGLHKIWIWGQGSSSYASDSWTLVVKGTSTSINNVHAKDTIKIRNMSEGVAVKLIDNSNEARILVHDMAGKLILQYRNVQDATMIEKSIFPSTGIYVITVATANLHRVEKVAIIQQ